MSDEIEEWRAVIGYEGLYEVSSLGGARSKPRQSVGGPFGKVRWLKGRSLVQSPNGDGYATVALYKDGKRKDISTHILICEAFHGPKPSPKHEVRHIDGTRTNNAASNLCWGLHIDNIHDMIDQGTFVIGEDVHTAVINENDVRDITRLLAKGISGAEIARRLKIPEDTVSRVKLGKNWAWFTGIVYKPTKNSR